ncbi:serine hydrolase domain-containing protein [Nocardia stercoris]|uniref:Class A beta-lactamase-related serine hydrolase n=1 Tax=Nocardia stercoris TaxID=2483361 RepID=A0A3M2KVV7_9NOCA|nr:serine hydrolase domain-containing protein [Nocardia stercoris]RMI29331.1 class A beta-lactamase-related serine hydrolase [Nocardia stercoris]
MGWSKAVFSLFVASTLALGIPATGAAQDNSGEGPRCAVSSGRTVETATPEQEGFDSARLAGVLGFAASRNRLDVQIFRRGCLVGRGPANDRNDGIPWNIWSATKAITSLVAGIASDDGKLDLDAPIGTYLPSGFGDAAHRSITARNLLTQTSGLKTSATMEMLTSFGASDPGLGAEAMAVPMVTAPGSTFAYSGRAIDLLSAVVEAAVGEPFQQFAQRELFDPLGIRRSDYYWARDRTGHTYGFANLLIPPSDFAKIGLLLAGDGRWGDRQVISAEYLHQALSPTGTNHCYGYLFWVGPGCAELPLFLPADSYTISGFNLQNVFVVPDLDLVVMWTGNGGTLWDEELPWEFFRRLYSAFDPPLPDPGPYIDTTNPLDNLQGISNDFDFAMLAGALGFGPDAYPGCSMVDCLGQPMVAPFTDAPPGCFLAICLGDDPRTPGIR